MSLSNVREETASACNALDDFFQECYHEAQVALQGTMLPFMVVSEAGRTISLNVDGETMLTWKQPLDLNVYFVEKAVGHSIVALYAIGSPFWDSKLPASQYAWKPKLETLKSHLAASLAQIQQESQGSLSNIDSLTSYLKDAVQFAESAIEAGAFTKGAYKAFALKSKNYLKAVGTFSAVADGAVDDLYAVLTKWKEQLGDSWERMIVAVESVPPGPDASKGATRSMTADTCANVLAIKSFMTPENARDNVLLIRNGANARMAISEAMLARRCAESLFPTPEAQNLSYGNYEALHDGVDALINPAAKKRLDHLINSKSSGASSSSCPFGH